MLDRAIQALMKHVAQKYVLCFYLLHYHSNYLCSIVSYKSASRYWYWYVAALIFSIFLQMHSLCKCLRNIKNVFRSMAS